MLIVRTYSSRSSNSSSSGSGSSCSSSGSSSGSSSTITSTDRRVLGPHVAAHVHQVRDQYEIRRAMESYLLSREGSHRQCPGDLNEVSY